MENAKTLMDDTARFDAREVAARIRSMSNCVGAEHRVVYKRHENEQGGSVGLFVEVATWYVGEGTPFYAVAILGWTYAVISPDHDSDKPYSHQNNWLKMSAGNRYIIEGDMSDLVEIGVAKWEELQRTRPWEDA